MYSSSRRGSNMENKTVVLVPPGKVGHAMRASLESNENLVVDYKPCDKVINAFTGEYVDMDKLIREFINLKKSRTNFNHCTGRKSDRKRNRKTRWS